MHARTSWGRIFRFNNINYIANQAMKEKYRVRQNYPDFLFSLLLYLLYFFYSDKMKSLKNLRDAIIRAHERGKKQVEIAEFLGISTSTVNDAIKRYKETGNNEDRKGRGRKKTARSRKNVQCAKGMIKRNPTTRANSTRKLAKKLDVSEASAR